MPAWDPQHPIQTPLDPEQTKHLQDALRDYDRALAYNPSDDLFWHNRAWIRLELGNAPDDVMHDIRRAVAIDGGSACYRVGFGRLLEQQGRTGEAGDQYAAALAAAPDSCNSEFARNLKSRSTLLWEMALSKAIGILRVRDPNDRDVSTRARLARLYLEQGQTVRAGTMLDTITKAMPQFPRAWANQGRIYLDSGGLPQAELCLKKAAFLDGSDPTVPTLLARIAEANGDQETAEYLQERALKIAGQQASPHARRLNRMYKTNAVVRDDVLPPGLLAYCTPNE
jgi:tetratricopeptide (TPR) repeat protein